MESQVDAAVLPVGESGENQGWLEPIGANWSFFHGLHASLLCFLSPSHISIPNKLSFLLVCQLSFVTPGIIQHPCPLAHSMRFPRWANRLRVCVQEDIHWVWHTKGVSLQVEKEILISTCMYEYERVYVLYSMWVCIWVWVCIYVLYMFKLCLDGNGIKWRCHMKTSDQVVFFLVFLFSQSRGFQTLLMLRSANNIKTRI